MYICRLAIENAFFIQLLVLISEYYVDYLSQFSAFGCRDLILCDIWLKLVLLPFPPWNRTGIFCFIGMQVPTHHPINNHVTALKLTMFWALSAQGLRAGYSGVWFRLKFRHRQMFGIAVLDSDTSRCPRHGCSLFAIGGCCMKCQTGSGRTNNYSVGQVHSPLSIKLWM